MIDSPFRQPSPADRIGGVWFPRDTGTIAAYRAVVVPLGTRRAETTPSAYRRTNAWTPSHLPCKASRILHLGRQWMARARKLSAMGWHCGGDKRLAYMARCLPAGFVSPDEVRFPCNVTGCPYCFMRQVAKAAWRVHNAFFPAGEVVLKRSAFDLVSVERRYHPELADPHSLSTYLKMRASRRGPCSRFRELRAVDRAFGPDGYGSIEFVHIADQAVTGTWEIAARQILLIPREARLPRGFGTPGTHVSMKVTPSPSRVQLMRAVVAAFRYPALYLTGKENRALAALESRRGCRLIESAGLLRKQETRPVVRPV